MSKIRMINGKIGLVKITTGPAKSDQSSVFAIPTVANDLAEVRFVEEGSEALLGKRVYYGKDVQEIKMQGLDVLVMPLSNVIAVIDDSEEEKA